MPSRRSSSSDISASQSGSQDTGTGTLTLAVVDDHPPIRQAFRDATSQRIDMDIVAEAGSAEEARSLLTGSTLTGNTLTGNSSPDVAVVDLTLGGEKSFGLLRTLRAECPETGVLVFSVHEERVYAERAFWCGASGYVMKPASTAEALKAARQVDRGEAYLSPEMRSWVLQGPDAGGDGRIHFPIDELTDRELEIFRMMGRGLTRTEIADRLGLARKTVETHRRHIKEKLGYENVDPVVSHASRWVQAAENESTT